MIQQRKQRGKLTSNKINNTITNILFVLTINTRAEESERRGRCDDVDKTERESRQSL